LIYERNDGLKKMGLWIMENKWQENRFYLEKMGEEKGSFSTNNGNTTINYINGD
jgi:hypothetical protein